MNPNPDKIQAVFVGGPLDGIRKYIIDTGEKYYNFDAVEYAYAGQGAGYHTGGKHVYSRQGLPLLVTEWKPVDPETCYVQVYRYDGIKRRPV